MLQQAALSPIVQQLRDGALDLISYVNEVCNRIEANEPQIQALLPEENRRERLLQEAQQLTERFPSTATRPALYGVLVGVKDIFHVQDFPTRAGSELPLGLLAGEEADCIRRFRRAGALILGKTVTTEFAYFEPGPTRNPWNLDHTPGGSSSGSAAAVAAGFCPLAIGTQTVGSVIRPAAFCGIVGFKPSYDRISTSGLVFLSPSADHVGLFAQDVAGMRIAAGVACRLWDQSAGQASKQPVIGVPEGKYLRQASCAALEAFEKALQRVQQAGCRVRAVRALDDIEEINARHKHMIAAEFAVVHRQWFAQYEQLYRPRTAQLVLDGRQVDAESLACGRSGRLVLRQQLEQLRDKAGIDIWASPAAVTEAPKGIQSTGDPTMNLPWTHAGLPTVTVPTGSSENGLPFGMQLSSASNEDERLLAWAELLVKQYIGSAR